MPYWEAFQRLSSQRDLGGMGSVGAIRYEAASSWLDEQRVLGAIERERFRFYIEQLDGEYLALRAKQMERQQAEIESKARVRHR